MNARRFTDLSALALLAALSVACESTPKVHANTYPAADLSSYRTYAFVAQPGTNRGGIATPLTGNFETAIARELDARGYRRVDGDPDLLVNFNANSRENADIVSTPAPAVGYYGYRAGLYAGGADIRTVRYRVGTANIDVVDARKKQVVWEGVAEGELTDAMMQDPQAAVSKAVAEMFTKFPGRAAP
jgi:hypothetical protein